MLSRERVLIVGGGRAGVSAAEELRRSGFAGEVVIFGDEAGLPYYRPSCSKGLLTGTERPTDLLLDLSGCVDVQWRLGQRVAALDPAGRTIETDDGQVHPYDGLIIATGSQAARLPKPDDRISGLHTLHTIEDAWAFRMALRDADRVAVVGGGLTGCETASAVRSLARECVLVESKPQVMTHALGRQAGRAITEMLWREGVELYLGHRLQGLSYSRHGLWWLTLDDGTEIDADLVAFTAGGRPDTTWLEGAPGLDISDGILCDENLRVVGAEGIVAAGAVARWPNMRTGTTPQRSGQWVNALQHGRAAAQALLAGDEPLPPVMPLHQLWSEQFGLRIQVAGEIAGPGATAHVSRARPGRSDAARAGLLVSYVRDERLSGVVAINAPRVYAALTRAILVSPHVPAFNEVEDRSLDPVELRDLVPQHRRPTYAVSSSLPERPSRVSPPVPEPVGQRDSQHSAPVPLAPVVRPARGGSADRGGRYEPVRPDEPRAPTRARGAETPGTEGDSGSAARPTISVNHPRSGEEPTSWAYS
jgi:NADPH-dependent 2,4-dienoyl-CoA reductase/sulfur reductase-like enzyme